MRWGYAPVGQYVGAYSNYMYSCTYMHSYTKPQAPVYNNKYFNGERCKSGLRTTGHLYWRVRQEIPFTNHAFRPGSHTKP